MTAALSAAMTPCPRMQGNPSGEEPRRQRMPFYANYGGRTSLPPPWRWSVLWMCWLGEAGQQWIPAACLCILLQMWGTSAQTAQGPPKGVTSPPDRQDQRALLPSHTQVQGWVLCLLLHPSGQKWWAIHTVTWGRTNVERLLHSISGQKQASKISRVFSQNFSENF